MTLRSLAVSFGAFFLVQPQAYATDFVPLDQLPAWFGESWKRTVNVSESTRVTVDEFNVDHDILGKVEAEKVTSGESSWWYFSIDMGADIPVECYAFSSYDGAANSLYALVSEVINLTAQSYSMSLNGTFNFSLDTGLVNQTPYLQLDTLYSLVNEETSLIGVVKALSAESGDTLQVCLHNEIGYKESFFSVFESFTSAFEAHNPSDVFFEPIYKMNIGGMSVGYSRESYSLDSDGDVVSRVKSSYLVPVDANTVSRADDVSISWSKTDGSLINLSEYGIENSVLTSSFTLQKPEDSWIVDGQLQGKPVQQQLSHKDNILSGYGSYVETLKLLDSDNSSTTFYTWLSDADPTSAVEATLEQVTNNLNANFAMTLGPLQMYLKAEPSGVIKQINMNQGPVEFTFELMNVKGAPVKP